MSGCPRVRVLLTWFATYVDLHRRVFKTSEGFRKVFRVTRGSIKAWALGSRWPLWQKQCTSVAHPRC